MTDKPDTKATQETRDMLNEITPQRTAVQQLADAKSQAADHISAEVIQETVPDTEAASGASAPVGESTEGQAQSADTTSDVGAADTTATSDTTSTTETA